MWTERQISDFRKEQDVLTCRIITDLPATVPQIWLFQHDKKCTEKLMEYLNFINLIKEGLKFVVSYN
jgi:hypothetical protein